MHALMAAALVMVALAAAPLAAQPAATGNATTGNSTDGAGAVWAGDSPVSARAFRFGTVGDKATLADNSCGFGPRTSAYTVGVSPNSSLVKLRPQSGCGTCLEVVCAEPSSACVNPSATTLPPVAANATADYSNATSNVLSPGRIILTVADTCLSCAPLDLNIHADAYQQLADPTVGIIGVTYRPVPCPSFGRNMSVYVSEFRASEGGYLRLSVRDVASDGLAEVAVAHCPRATDNETTPAAAAGTRGIPADSSAASDQAASKAGAANLPSASGGTRATRTAGRGGGLIPGCAGTLRGPIWRVMDNTAGAAWEYSGLPRLPLDLRLTGVGGQELILWNAITNTTAPAVYRTRAQFSSVDPSLEPERSNASYLHTQTSDEMRALAAALMVLAALAARGGCSRSPIDEALGAWGGGSPNFSLPVKGRAFRFGTAGENVTLANNSCAFGPSTSPYVVGVSPNSPLFRLRTQSGCGTCLEVVCVEPTSACVNPNATTLPTAVTNDTADIATSNVLSPGRLVLTIADTCESCSLLDLNIHADAFAQLADPAIGIINVTYRQIPCPSFGRNMSVYVSDFHASQGGYVRLSVRDVAGNGLAEVAVAHCQRNETAGTAGDGGLIPGCTSTLRGPIWRVMNNTAGAAWEYSGLPRLPLDLRLTSVGGQDVIVRNAITNSTAPALYDSRTQYGVPDPSAADGGLIVVLG
ncbi:hypothetical protein TSOC_009510 [Tetrabaena socialis]|uniref:Expansin-like EG45 domain-containing protein n=1 Tax=Tetrabaena socialis TaxID=47790 RepID=A0A2J7ZVP6_9CHLO|nr:hypothetical protein TSOC_009510 [Tetrabaena socialis]|eukprot:PNH04330.1 hypothetical protein TSOC_009510 [Tetrabaena socialis]